MSEGASIIGFTVNHVAITIRDSLPDLRWIFSVLKRIEWLPLVIAWKVLIDVRDL